MKTKFNPGIVPEDSILHLWLEAREILETPYSYDLAVAMSTVGACLKRTCWIDQKRFRVYPNMSTLLVGHSGIGKDTAIDGGEEILQAVDVVPVIGGRTSETISEKLLALGDPAAAVILAGELSEFFGPKDYQKGMMETITDLMSTKAYKDISLKSQKDQPRRIMRPTLTMLGGSTRDWLHTAMPEHAMSGGFYPRFLIVCEDEVKRQVPWVKYSLSPDEINQSDDAQEGFFLGVREIVSKFSNVGEVIPRHGGKEAYERFYAEREKYFSNAAAPYAHRCRDTALRIAIISAFTRFHDYVDKADFTFAAELMAYIGARVDEALAPPTVFGKIERDIMKLLPTTATYIYRSLGLKYEQRFIEQTIRSLESNSMRIKKDGKGIYTRVEV